MKDKIVVISGGAGGIGYTCAETFKKRGAKVIILDLAGDRLKEIENTTDYATYACNLTNIEEIQATTAKIIADYGKVDALIQVAGLMRNEDSFHITPDSWDLMFNINARGTFFLAKAMVEGCMKENGGAIVNFASAAAIRGFMGSMASPHYGASKAAIISLTQQLACEWGKYNVRVNAVVPGGVLTEAMKKMNFDQSSFDNIPLRSLSEPQDIANAVYFLASDEARMITGQALVIDGGANSVGQ